MTTMTTMTTKTRLPVLLTVAEAATFLRVSRPTIYRRVADGTLAAVRIGELGPVRILARELERFLGSGESSAAPRAQGKRRTP